LRMIPTPLQKTNQDRIVSTQELMSSDPSLGGWPPPGTQVTSALNCQLIEAGGPGIVHESSGVNCSLPSDIARQMKR
jgi:hypothetical protein